MFEYEYDYTVLELVSEVAEKVGYKEITSGDFQKRQEVVQYSWIMPTKENIQKILDEVKNANYVFEVGAGSGLVGKYIENMGIKYLGTKDSQYPCDKIQFATNIVDYREIDGIIDHDADTILMIWPPYDEPLAAKVFKAFKESPKAKKLIYVGEPYGCNGDEEWYNIFADNPPTKEIILDKWAMIHDDLYVWEKSDDIH